MIRHFIKTFFRSAIKNKWLTIIIISGLSLGLACSITILLWVRYELSFDDFHVNKNRIYQVQQTVKLESQDYTADRTGGAQALVLPDGFPEIESITRLIRVPEVVLGHSRKKEDPLESFIEDNIWAVDSTFLDIFSFKPLLGNIHRAFENESSIVLTQSLATKYFGKEWQKDPNIIGAILRIDNREDLTISGVLADPPNNSNIQFDALIPLGNMADFGFPMESFGGTVYHTYLMLQENATSHNLEENITTYLQGLHEPEIESEQFLVPLDKVHLYDEQRNYLGVYAFGAIGLFILIIACINYINLSTAVGISRGKEVGIRKVEGANRYQLLVQFLGEAFIITLVSTQIAIIAVELFIIEFNRLANTHVTINYASPGFIISIIFLILFTTLMAGAYPAFVLSKKRPAEILKSSKQKDSRGAFLRKILVVAQFSITIFFIICTIVTIKQFRFMDTADLGFNKDNMVFIPLRGEQMDNYNSIKTELLRSPDIENITTGSAVPGWVELGAIEWGLNTETNNALARILTTGYDFIEAFDIEMAAGRFYSKEYTTDSTNAIIVNETIVEMLGYESPIGAQFYLWGDPYTIIGVVKDFNFFPFNLGGSALIMPFHEVQDLMFLKLRPGNEGEILDFTKQTMAKFNPQFPFEFYHLNEYDHPFMNSRNNINLLLIYFSLFGILISCMGLYGLTIHISEIKTKEIGIRKAFGASVARIVGLLSGGFLKLVIISNLIAIPFAYLLMNSVLNFFTARVNLSIWIFMVTALTTVLLALITIAGKSLHAASRNPIESLKYE